SPLVRAPVQHGTSKSLAGHSTSSPASGRLRVKITLDHARRYSRIARLLWKYGRGDLIERVEVDGGLDESTAPKNGGGPDELADDLEKMGPTYIKLGQVLSSRPDLLPEAYVKALTRLQDKVKPFSFAEVE